MRGNVVANGRDPLAARTSHAPIPFPVIAALQMFENNDVTSPNGKMSGCFQGLVKSFWWVMMKPLAFFFWLVFFGFPYFGRFTFQFFFLELLKAVDRTGTKMQNR